MSECGIQGVRIGDFGGLVKLPELHEVNGRRQLRVGLEGGEKIG